MHQQQGNQEHIHRTHLHRVDYNDGYFHDQASILVLPIQLHVKQFSTHWLITPSQITPWQHHTRHMKNTGQYSEITVTNNSNTKSPSSDQINTEVSTNQSLSSQQQYHQYYYKVHCNRTHINNTGASSTENIHRVYTETSHTRSTCRALGQHSVTLHSLRSLVFKDY